MRIRVVDFFCGCGGTSAGFLAAGMTILMGIDNDPDAARTFSHNFPRATFLPKRIQEVRSSELLSTVSVQRDYPLLFAACAPCQPFSKQNQKRVQRIRRGGDASMLDELHRFIRFYLPEYIFLENVPGLQQVSTRTGPFARLLRVLGNLNYHLAAGIVQSQDFGVPQRRQRLVLLASRLGPIKFPPPTHGPGSAIPDYSSTWDWISDLPPIGAGESHPDVPNHCARSLSKINLDRIRATPPGGDRRNWPSRLTLRCHENYSGHSDVYGRLRKDRPASALTTKCITLSNGRFGHPEADRAISVREAACLQTFPRDFIFFGSLTSMSRQIGNAVPVLLAKSMGRAITRHYRCHRKAHANLEALDA